MYFHSSTVLCLPGLQNQSLQIFSNTRQFFPHETEWVNQIWTLFPIRWAPPHLRWKPQHSRTQSISEQFPSLAGCLKCREKFTCHNQIITWVCSVQSMFTCVHNHVCNWWLQLLTLRMRKRFCTGCNYINYCELSSCSYQSSMVSVHVCIYTIQ